MTIETGHRTLVHRRRLASNCPICESDAPLLTPEEAAALAGTTVREIYRRVEAGQVHFNESGDRTLLICSFSLTTS